MCSRYVRKIDRVEIEDLFQDMLSNNDLPKQFSAYDVTTAIRKEVGPTVEVPHNEVRTVVHDLLDNDSSFVKTQHPVFNALTYERVAQPANPNVTTPPVGVVVHNPVQQAVVPVTPVCPPLGNLPPHNVLTNTVPTKGLRKPDKRGTLTVPKSLLDNLQSVRKFMVYSGTNTIQLKPLTTNLPTRSMAGIYTKDCHGNVRVTKKHLPKSTTGSYLVKWDGVNSRIVIEGV